MRVVTSGSGGPEVPGYGDLRVLGRGGFATVYRARQVAFDREVALKVLDGAPTDERTRQLFARECRAAGSLSWHPHVVVVHDAGTTPGGTSYLAMELLPGGSLAGVLAARGPLGQDEAVRVAGEVAAALVAAHEDHLLHRDVKPANVLVDRLGRAKLADFGIARVVGAGSATATGAVTGTVAYMAPEVLRGGKASPASDVYALGLTLLTFLAGRNPLTSEEDDSPFVVIARVVAGTLPAVPDGVTPELRALIEACTASDPAARPSTAEVAATLAGLAGASPGATATPPVPPPSPPPSPPLAPPPGVPPPPTSAVRVRPDHTLAEPPPPRPDLAPTLAGPAPPGPDLAPTRAVDPTQVAPGSVAPPPEGGRSRRGPVAAAAALVVLLLVVGAVVLLGGDDDTPAADGAPTTTVAAEVALEDALLAPGDVGSTWVPDPANLASVLEDIDDPPCTEVEAVDAVAVAFEDGSANLTQRIYRMASEADAITFVDDEGECNEEPIEGVGDQAAFGRGTDTNYLAFRVGDVVCKLVELWVDDGGILDPDAEVVDVAVAKVEAL